MPTVVFWRCFWGSTHDILATSVCGQFKRGDCTGLFQRFLLSVGDVVEMARASVDTVGHFNAATYQSMVHLRLPALGHFREFN